jgi:hypothetical protein
LNEQSLDDLDLHRLAANEPILIQESPERISGLTDNATARYEEQKVAKQNESYMDSPKGDGNKDSRHNDNELLFMKQNPDQNRFKRLVVQEPTMVNTNRIDVVD